MMITIDLMMFILSIAVPLFILIFFSGYVLGFKKAKDYIIKMLEENDRKV